MGAHLPGLEATAATALFRERLEAVPLLAPTVCDARLQAAGYRGQDQARRAASVLAYRHVRRLRRLFLEHEDPEAVGPRDNYLFMGPTGCGKTYLSEVLFRDILKVPTVTVDVTQFSETGYIGDDATMILSRLFEAAGQDLLWASCGVVCLDEFDKLASSRTNARFAGEGTTKDVSGYGVQRSLLTLLSAGSAEFSVDFGYAQMGPKLAMPLAGLTFIACGAFSGFQATADGLGDADPRMGFGNDVRKRLSPDAIAQAVDAGVLEQTAAFARYGFLPELVGRFSRLVAFEPLNEATLREILNDGVLAAYLREFAYEGLRLEVTEPVMKEVVKRAMRRELGARGLRAALVPVLEEAAYQHFGTAGEVRAAMSELPVVRLVLKSGEIAVEQASAMTSKTRGMGKAQSSALPKSKPKSKSTPKSRLPKAKPKPKPKPKSKSKSRSPKAKPK